MDPSLLIWFRTPMGTLMTASRTVNFQQAEVSRLVSHLREQISKQNKALKKAAQQIRENEKTLQNLQDAKREVIVLKQEIRKIQNNTGSNKGDAMPHSLQPTGVIRPIPQQSTSGGGMQFLATASETRSDHIPSGGMHNDGFGTEPPRSNGGRGAGGGMGDPGQNIQFQQAQQQRPLQQLFTQNIPENRMQNPVFRDNETGVILSDRTKGMGTFKHPDILAMSPRKRLRTEHVEGPQHEPIRSLGLHSLREGQNFTPNPPNNVNQARISLPPAGANGARPGNLIQGSSKSLLYPNQRNALAHEDFHAIDLRGGRSNPDIGINIERNVSRTSSRASARERLQQFKFDGNPAQHSSSPFAQPQSGMPTIRNLRPSTAMDTGSRRGPISLPPTTARPQSVADRPSTMTPRPGTTSVSHHFTPRGRRDAWIAPAATTGNANHSRFMAPGRRPS
ncbi:hypothetical protein QFC21_004913 [Naganishia friedmannii]|uniref:Uncharacterized protein n=1 Tax=Naganishia friedmannii TaxID=89922 RepID=A0ACC2VE45_9TREE|nr:hypothetical protein QFC21_004913 [Naganishia friedmannii]